MIAISLFAAVTPMVFFLILLWKFDKYEREPLALVVLHFLWGASVAIILGFVGSKLISFPLDYFIIIPEKVSFIQIILIAPFVEELAKGSLLFWTMKNKRFDNINDGLVYGGAIGLGFGMTENFLYFIFFGSTISNLIWLIVIRSGFSAVMHCVSTSALGALLSVSKYSKERNQKLLMVVGFIIAVSIHFIWNFGVSFSSTFLFGIFFIVVILGVFITVFLFALKFERQIIKEKLIGEIPEKYIPILTSPFRSRKGWFEEEYRSKFISASVTLAYRKHELEISSKKRELYSDEIIELRTRILALIELNNKAEIDI